jgi:hypothetical protein
MLQIQHDLFSKNLWLTQQYCERQLANSPQINSTVLRSYNPVHNGKGLFSYNYSGFPKPETSAGFFTVDWTDDAMRRTEELFLRQLRFKESDVKQSGSFKDLPGNILVAKVGETVIDGASCIRSKGLIDDFDLPPIDTWFYLMDVKLYQQLLFAWIPEKLYELANEAILVNCMDCIGWYKDWFPEESALSDRHFQEQYLSM